MPEKSFSAATDDLAVATITSLIKLDKAAAITVTKQSDGSWLIKATLPKKP